MPSAEYSPPLPLNIIFLSLSTPQCTSGNLKLYFSPDFLLIVIGYYPKWDFTRTALMLHRVIEPTWNSGYSICMFSSLTSHSHAPCTHTHTHIYHIQPGAKPLSHGPPTSHPHGSPITHQLTMGEKKS